MDIKQKELTPEELEMINGGLVVACPGYGGVVVDDNTGEILFTSPHIIEAIQLAAQNNVNSHVISGDEYQQRFGKNIWDLIG